MMISRMFLAATFAWFAAAAPGVAETPQPLEVTLDWLPSPEYYGFYYAAATGGYKAAGLDVTFKNASGAPIVAAELAAGSITVGTTTSDNILRQAVRGVKFYQLVPIERFNPVSIVSLPRKPLSDAADFTKGNSVTVGTNPQSSTYAQFQYYLQIRHIPFWRVKEYPIGYGGAAQLLSGQVQGFLAYTTNQAIDVELLSHEKPIELSLEKEGGLKTYGLVLAVTPSDSKEHDHLAELFVRATLKGYQEGAVHLDDAVNAVKMAEPTLNPEKVKRAIKKMVDQNNGASNKVPAELDAWVKLDQSESKIRATKEDLAALYQAGLELWSDH